MSEYLIKRVIDIADHIINSNDTIRKTALIFNVSKSTVHNDIHERLVLIDKDRYCKVKKIMDEHIKMRHILGGEATRKLFLENR